MAPSVSVPSISIKTSKYSIDSNKLSSIIEMETKAVISPGSTIAGTDVLSKSSARTNNYLILTYGIVKYEILPVASGVNLTCG